jgi:hypothetical protein
VLQDFVSPSARCVEGAEFLLEELEAQDPDLDERCGLLDGRHEIYAVVVPGCSSLVLVVSLDVSGRQPWRCTVHGLLARRGRPCDAGRARAARHFDLVNPSWEPADGKEGF